MAIGERIRASVADGPDSVGMTLSIGIVDLPWDASVDLDTALAAADRAMYQSKSEGENCVSLGTLVEMA